MVRPRWNGKSDRANKQRITPLMTSPHERYIYNKRKIAWSAFREKCSARYNWSPRISFAKPFWHGIESDTRGMPMVAVQTLVVAVKRLGFYRWVVGQLWPCECLMLFSVLLVFAHLYLSTALCISKFAAPFCGMIEHYADGTVASTPMFNVVEQTYHNDLSIAAWIKIRYL